MHALLVSELLESDSVLTSSRGVQGTQRLTREYLSRLMFKLVLYKFIAVCW